MNNTDSVDNINNPGTTEPGAADTTASKTTDESNTPAPSGLSPAKQALLELRLKKLQAEKQKAAEAAQATNGTSSAGATPSASVAAASSEKSGQQTIPRRESEGPAPLSYSQELLWLLDQMSPGSVSYHSPGTRRVTGPIRYDAMERALTALVERHEVLRTNIVLQDGSPVQVVRSTPTLTIPVVDLRHLPADVREAEGLRLTTEEIQSPFDMAHDLMIRATLFRLADEDHILAISLHHITTDARSKEVMWTDLLAYYTAFCRGEEPALAPLPIQYADFAEWQRKELAGPQMDRQLEYWKKKLAGSPVVTDLPLDRPRPPHPSEEGAAALRVLPPETARAMQALSRRENVTMFMAMQAAVNTLIYRYTGQTDIVLGTPIAGRTRREIEGLLGYFSNTLALRNNLDGDPTFSELLKQVRDTSLGAFDNQELPFDKVVVELRPERRLSVSPIFQVMFGYGQTSPQPLHTEGATLEHMIVYRGTAKFEMTVSSSLAEEGLRVGIEYRKELFDEATIQRMLDCFVVLIHGIIANPNVPISSLPFLPETERQSVITDWNQTDTPYSSEECVHTLFAAQAKRTPDAVAVRDGNRSLTYREFNAKANQVAHFLRKHGVGPDVPVGICMERSLEMAVGLMGILKAGGACTPLDPSYPRERLTFMVDDMKASVLLTQRHLKSELPGNKDVAAEIFCLDDENLFVQESDVDLDRAETGVTPNHVAYVLFTSGSTGKPRGVQLTHQGLVNHHEAAIKLYGLRPGDRVLQFSSPSFDIAVEEMYPTWLSGGTVVFRQEQMSISGKTFLDWLNQEGITVLDLPTAYWHEWVNELALLQAEPPKSLRLVIVGGEKAQASVYAKWREMVGTRVKWLNTYGPTETCIVATAFDPEAEGWIPAADREIPIGRPIANTQTYVLNKHQQPVPIGVPGELYIGGDGLARGYLKRPELTAEKFLPDPFRKVPGARIYRTGDLVRWKADGTIEFVGRADHQVKIRGFRIEPGEIEVLLGQHPAVREAVVLVREDQPGDKRLVAYVAAPPDQDVDISVLRAYLRENLPDYMLPAAIVVMETFPLTPNGKVDRRALPAPEAGQNGADGENNFAAPRDAIERRLVDIWESTLNVRPIGVKDNFFDLGGHSLMAVRLLSYIEKAFDTSLPLATLFQAPTIEEMAKILGQEGWTASWSSLVEIQPRGTKSPFFCVHAFGANVLNYRLLSSRMSPDQPFYGLQAQGLDGKSEPHTTVEEMAAHYIQEMKQVQPHGPYYVGGGCTGGIVAFEIAQQLVAAGEMVAALILIDSAYIPTNTLYVRHPREAKARLTRRAYVMDVHYGGFLLKEPPAQRAYIREKIKAKLASITRKISGMFGVKVAPSLPDALQRVRVANRRATLSYVPKSYPGRVICLLCTEHYARTFYDHRMGWNQVAEDGMEVKMVAGDHDSMLEAEHVDTLAATLQSSLDKAAERAEERILLSTLRAKTETDGKTKQYK